MPHAQNYFRDTEQQISTYRYICIQVILKQ
jgi:hypothetical protein